MANHLNKGYFGEQGAGFFLGKEGYFFLDGPSGKKGHKANASGFDGVAFNPKSNKLIIYDNKSFTSDKDVRSATAVDPAVNFSRNLDKLIDKIRTSRDIPYRIVIIGLLEKTRESLTNTNINPPPGVMVAITNFGGNSADINARLKLKGLTFIDMMKTPFPLKIKYITLKTIIYITRRLPRFIVTKSRQIRPGQMSAVASALGFIASTADEYALSNEIERALHGPSGAYVHTVLASGDGALIAIRIPTIKGALDIQSLGAIDVVAGRTREEAFGTYTQRGYVTRDYGSHVAVEERFIWIAPQG